LQPSRFPKTGQLAHDQAQIESADVHEQPFGDVLVAPQMRASWRRSHSSERSALDQLAALTHQPLASASTHPPAVGIHRRLIGRFPYSRHLESASLMPLQSFGAVTGGAITIDLPFSPVEPDFPKIGTMG
jgi:hypothetical protein